MALFIDPYATDRAKRDHAPGAAQGNAELGLARLDQQAQVAAATLASQSPPDAWRGALGIASVARAEAGPRGYPGLADRHPRGWGRRGATATEGGTVAASNVGVRCGRDAAGTCLCGSHGTAPAPPRSARDAARRRPGKDCPRDACAMPPDRGLAIGLQVALAHLSAREAERRPVSILFCDLVDSVGLSSRHDLEDYGALVLAYRKVCAHAVAAAGGIVAQYVGDGIMACFGYPVAHEDDPVRAVRAGLGVLGAMRDLNGRLVAEGRPALAVRAAVHTDIVLAGDLGAGTGQQPMAIMGEGPNLAARLQQAAEPDTLLVSDATFRAVQGFFECSPLSPQPVRGLSRMVEAFAVVGPTGAATRLEARRTLTPLVGRAHELAELRRLWSRAVQGFGRMVVLRSAAGVGKSRLALELQAQAAASKPSSITWRCGQEYTTDAFWPLATKNRRWSKGSPRHFRELADVVDRLLSPRTVHRPILLVVEDLQWADRDTLQLLESLLERLPAAAALAVLTARPEFGPPWLGHPNVTLLEPRCLRESEASEMLESLAIGKNLAAVARREILERADGVPLFIEELTRAAPDSGSTHGCGASGVGVPTPLAIPITLRGLVMSHLDRFGEGKAVAQLCAGLGPCFSQVQVQTVAGIDAMAALRTLDRLVAEQFLDRHGSGAEVSYSFRHPLVREATYESMLLARRRLVHQ